MNFDFQIIFTGTGSAFATPDRIGSSLLIFSGKKFFLIDCPGGISTRLSSTSLEGQTENLDALFVTHRHIDHSSGFIELLYYLYLHGGKKRISPLKVYAHPKVIEILKGIYKAYHLDEKSPFITIQWETISFDSFSPIFRECGMILTPFESPHDPSAPTFGLIMQKNLSKVVYTSDCSYEAPLPETLFQDSGLYITESTYSTPTTGSHAAPENALELCKRNQLSSLYLIHLGVEFHRNETRKGDFFKRAKAEGIQLIFPSDLDSVCLRENKNYFKSNLLGMNSFQWVGISKQFSPASYFETKTLISQRAPDGS